MGQVASMHHVTSISDRQVAESEKHQLKSTEVSGVVISSSWSTMGTPLNGSGPLTARSNGTAVGLQISEPRKNSFYARDLRVVGQLLESNHIATADLVLVADVYVVQGRAKTNGQDGFASSLWQAWLARVGSILTGNARYRNLPPGTVILRFTREDIVEFDSLARQGRSNPNGMPEPHALSQILRSVGTYLDSRERSSLIGISLRERWMTIRFETGDGRLEEKQRDVDYFYDYWVNMYLRRHEWVFPTATLPPPLGNKL